jgi:hypothetical protein
MEQRVSPVRPLLEGDIVAGSRVTGFAWASARRDGASTHLDDRLLLDGDETLVTPPGRPVPQTADGARTVAVVPPQDLPADQVRAAAAIDAGLTDRADALLDLPGAPWQRFVRPLLAAVHATGHRLWLAGGAVRDLVAGVPAPEIADLDLSGTVPPGRFTDIAYQALRASRMSEARTTITPGSLVCAAMPPGSTTRLFEYRGLTKGGFRFPAVGSTIAEDARHRDFSFNALLYDVLDHQVVDASGTGLDDLLGERRRFVPQSVHDKPLAQALIIVRAAKFALRWDMPLDLTPLRSWIAGLSPTLCLSLTSSEWNGLRTAYRRTISAPQEQQAKFAATLPEPGRELLTTLMGPAR